VDVYNEYTINRKAKAGAPGCEHNHDPPVARTKSLSVRLPERRIQPLFSGLSRAGGSGGWTTDQRQHPDQESRGEVKDVVRPDDRDETAAQ